MTVRQYMYDAIKSDPQLNLLGLTEDNLWAGQSKGEEVVPVGDQRRFAIMSWTFRNPALMGQRGPGRSWEQMLDLYLYNRDDDFSILTGWSRRLQEICDEVFAVSTGAGPHDGFISCVEWNGELPDGYDEVYNASSRVVSMTIVGKGE